MYVSSLIEKGLIDMRGPASIATTASDVQNFLLKGSFRQTLIVQGEGAVDPVGSIEISLGTKPGAGAVVPFPAGTLISMSTGKAATVFDSQGMVALAAGGKVTVPAAEAALHNWTRAFLFDVAVLPDHTDQISVTVKNNGTAGATIRYAMIHEHMRY